MDATLIERLDELRALETDDLALTLVDLMTNTMEENEITRHHLDEFRNQGLELATKFKQGELTVEQLAQALVQVVPGAANPDILALATVAVAPTDPTPAWPDGPTAIGLFNPPDLPSLKLPEDWRTAAEYLAQLPLIPFRVLDGAGKAIREVGSQAVESTAQWARRKLISDEEIELAKIGVGISAVGVLYTVLKE